MKNKENNKKHLWPLILGGVVGTAGIASGVAMLVITHKTKTEPSDVFQVIFDANGGGQIVGSGITKTQAGTQFGDIIKPEVSPDQGFTFKGWYLDRDCRKPVPDSMIISGPTTFYADFTAEQVYKVTFAEGTHFSGVTISGNKEVAVEQTGVKFKNINKPVATVSGKTFQYWTSVDGSPGGKIDDEYEIQGDITLYPYFTTEGTYAKLTFDANGGVLSGITSFEIPTTTEFYAMSKPIATNAGKDFDYWAYVPEGGEENKVKDTDKFSVDTKVYAIYKDVNIQEKVYYEDQTNGQKYWLTNLTDTTGQLWVESALGDRKALDRETFDAHLTIGSDITDIDINFLYGCTSFTNGGQPLVMPAGLVSIGDSFMGGCMSFDQSIVFDQCSYLTSIGSSFMQYCLSFNSIIQWPKDPQVSELVLGSFFLESCTAFNQPISTDNTPLPKNLLVIPHSFLSNCSSFNNGGTDGGDSEFIIPPNVQKIESYFLSGCYGYDSAGNMTGFNQKINIPESVQVISEDFLYACARFNQPLTFAANSKISEIPSGFLTTCVSFNQELALPTTVKTIGDFFLYQCESFNNGNARNFIVPNVTSIGSHFLADCKNFAKDLTIPSSIDKKASKVGIYFMDNCFSMGGHTIYINCSASMFEASDNTLSAGNNEVSCFTQGINIDFSGTGTAAQLNANNFNSKFSYSSTLPYRKLNITPSPK